jgi:plasmid stability protein
MATLHVRNFPDPLYDALRASAEGNGRSIGSEAITLIQRGLGPAGGRMPWRRRARTGTGFLTRFTEAGRAVVTLAQREARQLEHDHVGTEHLLLGLLRRPLSPAGRALSQSGVELDAARAAVVRLRGEGTGSPAGRLPFSPRAKQVLELALREALAMKHNYIGTEHILIGITRLEASTGARVLAEIEPDLEAVRARVARPPLEMLAIPRPSEFKVVELEGESDDWERQLNEAAAEGYELVQLVLQRAIFRRP